VAATEDAVQLDAFADDPLHRAAEARAAARLEAAIEARRETLLARLPRTGTALRRWRRQRMRGTQAEAAAALGISRRLLQRLEAQGERALPARIPRLVAGHALERGWL
jgi:hypothetical protein